jgi:hypothetical protein
MSVVVAGSNLHAAAALHVTIIGSQLIKLNIVALGQVVIYFYQYF